MSDPDQTHPGNISLPAAASQAEELSGPARPVSAGRIPTYLAALTQWQQSANPPILSLILFGSAAKLGFASETSDVDLIVVIPDGASRADRTRSREHVSALELTHGLRAPSDHAQGRLQAFAERVAGHAMSSFVCTRSDLLSGDVARILDLSSAEALFVDRIVLASILVSAVTLCGEDLLPAVPIAPIRRLDIFKSLFNFTSAITMSAILFPVLPDATHYAIDILKHSVHSCYFCHHLKAAPLAEEVAFFTHPGGPSETLQELLEQRRTYSPSFPFILRCLPALLQLHLLTARQNRFPRFPARPVPQA